MAKKKSEMVVTSEKLGPETTESFLDERAADKETEETAPTLDLRFEGAAAGPTLDADGFIATLAEYIAHWRTQVCVRPTCGEDLIVTEGGNVVCTSCFFHTCWRPLRTPDSMAEVPTNIGGRAARRLYTALARLRELEAGCASGADVVQLADIRQLIAMLDPPDRAAG